MDNQQVRQFRIIRRIDYEDDYDYEDDDEGEGELSEWRRDPQSSYPHQTLEMISMLLPPNA